MGKARWSDPQGVDRIRQQKLIATAVAEAVGETATDVAVQRCFPRNVTTLPPLPGVLTLADGAFGYYVDSMPVVSDGHTAWTVSGALYNNALDLPNSPYYADGNAYGLPFILPFDLDNEMWLDPIPIPLPPQAVFDPPPPPEWTQGGTITSRDGWGVTSYAVDGGPVQWILNAEWIFASSPVGQNVPAFIAPAGWTAYFGQGDPVSVVVHPENRLGPGESLGKNGAGTHISLALVPDDASVITTDERQASATAGPCAPPVLTDFLYGPNAVTYTPPTPTLVQTVGIWGAEGMYAGLIGRKIYFGGGDGDIAYNISNILLASYDLDTGEFDWTLPNLPSASGVPLQADYIPYAVADGKLWVVGTDQSDATFVLCSFDPAMGTWTVHAGTVPADGSLNTQMQGVQVGRTILWPVKSTDYGQIVYDIDADTWDTSGTLGFTGDPPAVAVAPDGRVWAVCDDGTYPVRHVTTRIIETDGTVTAPTADSLRFDGNVPSGDGRYGVLPLPDGQFAAATYLGLAFRSSDGKPYLFGGTTVKTAEVDTVHLPYLHANATSLPLGDGSVETVRIGTLPSDRTRLAAIALDGTASAVQLASDPAPPPLPGIVVTRDNSNGTRLRHADSAGNPLDGPAEYRLLDDDLAVLRGDNAKARISAYPWGTQVHVETHDAADPSQFGSANMQCYSSGGASDAHLQLVASTSRDNLFVGQEVVSGPDDGGYAATSVYARDHDYAHESSVAVFAGRAGSFRPGASLVLNATDGPAYIYVQGVNGDDQPPLAIGTMFAVHQSGDVEIYSASSGVILASPDSTRHRIKVANDGSLSTEVVS